MAEEAEIGYISKTKEDVVVDDIAAFAIVRLVAQYDPSRTLVVVALRKASIPSVLEPEAGHAQLYEALGCFVLVVHGARTWLHLGGDKVRYCDCCACEL